LCTEYVNLELLFITYMNKIIHKLCLTKHGIISVIINININLILFAVDRIIPDKLSTPYSTQCTVGV